MKGLAFFSADPSHSQLTGVCEPPSRILSRLCTPFRRGQVYVNLLPAPLAKTPGCTAPLGLVVAHETGAGRSQTSRNMSSMGSPSSTQQLMTMYMLRGFRIDNTYCRQHKRVWHMPQLSNSCFNRVALRGFKGCIPRAIKIYIYICRVYQRLLAICLQSRQNT